MLEPALRCTESLALKRCSWLNLLAYKYLFDHSLSGGRKGLHTLRPAGPQTPSSAVRQNPCPDEEAS
jgi:hypothetical protein